MQDSNAVSATTPTDAGSGGRAGAGGRREPGTVRTTTTQVSSSAGAPRPYHPFPSLHLSSPAPVCYGSVLRKRLRSEHSRQPRFLFPRHRMPACAPPKFQSQGLYLELLRDPSCRTRIHF